MARSRTVLAWIAVVVLGLAAFAAEAWRRHALYWYPVRSDYAFRFDASRTRIVTVDVGHDDLVLPDDHGMAGVALLELRVRARPTGWWFEPCIDVTAGGTTRRQCFERGARGLRYVLLPDGTANGDGQIGLRGHHLAWAAQTTRLIEFKPPVLAGARVLVLAPHPDDAEIAAFGLYSTQDAWVATLTAGNYVDGRYDRLALDAAAQDAWRGEVRVWDSLVVPQLGGVPADRVVNLGYVTHSLRAFPEAAHGRATQPAAESAVVAGYRQGAVDALLAGRPASADWSSVVQDLAALVTAVRPDVIVTPHYALDVNADHQYTTIALLAALELLQDRSTTLLMYTNHNTLAEHYPYGPSTALVTLPPWLAGMDLPGLYSHALDEPTQLRKLFALEAMHDLRAAPARVDGGPAGVLLQRLGEAWRLVKQDPFGDYSYFRRAVRPNELFLVYDAAVRPTVAEATDAAELSRSPPP